MIPSFDPWHREKTVEFMGSSGPIPRWTRSSTSTMQASGKRFFDSLFAARDCRASADYITHINRVWMLNYTLACHGHPLSQDSSFFIEANDYLVGYYRLRNVPLQFDGSVSRVSSEAALKVAAKSFLGLTGLRRSSQKDPDLEYFVDDKGTGKLSWHLVMSSGSQIQPRVEEYFISAVGRNPSILAQRELLMRAVVRSLGSAR